MPALTTFEVTPDHPVPISPQGGTATVTVLSGDTLYYADTPQVSAANNQGTVTAGNVQSFTSPTWVRSASLSTVLAQVSQPDPPIGGGSASSPTTGAVGFLPFPTGIAANDTANLNAALARGGTIRPNPLVVKPVYSTNAPLVVPASTDVDFGAAVFNLTAGSNCNMVNNAAVAAANTAADGSTTAASNVVTSATIAAVAQVGNQLAVVAAGPGSGGAGYLYGTVTAVNTVAHTVTISNSASVTIVSGATVYLYTSRDSAVRVVGGTWNQGDTRSATGFNQHVMRFRRCDGLYVGKISQSSLNIAAGGGGGYGINPGDCTNWTIENVTSAGNGTAVQVNGPCQYGVIKNMQGQTQDDMVALSAVDSQAMTDVEGDIKDVEIDGIFSNGSWRALSLFAGTGANGVQRALQHVTAKTVRGTTLENSSHIYNYAGNTQANDILIEDFTCLPSNPALYAMCDINAAVAQKVTLRDFTWGYNASAPPTKGIITCEGPIKELNVENLTVQGALAGTSYGVAVGTVDGATSAAIATLKMTNLSVPDGIVDFRPVQMTSTAASITDLQINGVHFPGGGTLIRNDGPGTITGLLSNVNLGTSNVYRGGTAGTNTATLSVVNSKLGGSFSFLTKNPLTLTLDAVTMANTSAAIQASGANATPCTFNLTNVTKGSGALWSKDGTQTVTVSGKGGSLATSTPTLAAGTVAVADTAIQAGSLVRTSRLASGGTLGNLSVVVTAGTGYTVNSSSATDTSTVLAEVVQY